MTAPAATLALGGMSRFIGRTREVAWLRQLLAEASAGQARIGLLGGEPGIGKTKLVREFLGEADAAGWQTVSGHCSADAATPHLPFATGLLPQLRRAGLLPDAAGLPGGEDLPMLAANLATLTVELARKRPLVFAIDDYQFAEPATLRLIGEYVRNLSEASRREPLRLLVVMTHHIALAGDEFGVALAQVRREAMVQSLDLAGLAEVEVHELIREAAQSPCDPQLLGAVLGATGGNPLFVLEVLRDLESRQLLRFERGYLTTPEPGANLHLPANAPIAVKKRLESLDAGALALLQVGSLSGDWFSLEEVAGLVDGDLELAADEAIGAGLLVASAGSLAFSHGMVRTAAAESILPMRRRRLHAEIARRLIAREGDSTAWAIEIANQIAAAEEWPDQAEAGAIFARAGDVALDSFLWGTAQRFFEAALAQRGYVEGLGVRERGLLLARAARANNNNGDRDRSRELHRSAMEALREAGDLAGWGLQLLGWWRTFTNSFERLPDDDSFEEFIAAAGSGVLEVQAQLLMHRAEALWRLRDPNDHSVGLAALEMADRTTDPETRAYAAVVMGLIENRHLRAASAIEHLQRAESLAAGIASPRVKNWGPSRLAMPLVLSGELEAARSVCERSGRLATAGHDLANGPLNLAMFHQVAVLTGQLELAQALRAEGGMARRRTMDPAPAMILCSGSAWERMLRGEYEESADALEAWAESGGRSPARTTRLLLMSRSGEAARARQELSERPLVFGASGVDFTNVGSIAVAGELASDLGLRDVAQRVLELLTPVIESGIAFSVSPPVSLPRGAAAAARTCGRLDEAGRLLELAARVAEQSGAIPEVALTWLERARLLVAKRARKAEIQAAAESSADVMAQMDLAGGLTWLREFAEGAAIPLRPTSLLDSEHDIHGTEQAILRAFSEARDPKQIADELLLTTRTVELHLSRIARRLGVTDAASAQAFLKAAPKTPGAAAGSRRPELAELTTRELEVLQLIARGLTNQQIADELVISPHTAIRHVANILGKTGAMNRTEAARLAG